MLRFSPALIILVLPVVLPSLSVAQRPSAPEFTAAAPAASNLGTASQLPAGVNGRAPEPAWRQDFEGPATSWTDAGGDAQYSIVAHQRVRGGAHSGQGCEWIQVVGQGGGSVLVAHDIGRPWVIDDLRPVVWVYADRPGVQFFAEIALPRTLDPRSGKPLVTTVPGSVYSNTGRWQQLEIVDIPRMLARQVRILRSQSGRDVDSREAYVSRLLLNVYAGAGVTNVWTDDLEVLGHVPSGSAAAPIAPASTAAVTSPVGFSNHEAAPGVAIAAGRSDLPRRATSNWPARC